MAAIREYQPGDEDGINAVIKSVFDEYGWLWDPKTENRDTYGIEAHYHQRGGGFWVMTPLRTKQGVVLVNRGFVPEELRTPASRSAGQIAGPVAVTGLLRLTEPGGTALRANDPRANRWYSRDVAAIARSQGLGRVAPYFRSPRIG